VALAALCVRATSIAQPLGIDQSLWASAVRGMARGQLLYRDVWEQRPPAIYWVYLGAFELFGWVSSSVAWLDLLAAAVTTFCVYLVGRSLSTTTTAGAAAALYAAMTMPAWLYGYGGFLERAVSETFIAVCVGLMACAAIRWSRTPSMAAALTFGFFAGVALVFKPNAGLYFLALMAWAWMYRSAGVLGRTAMPAALAAAAAAAVLPAITLLWLWRLDLLAEARVAVIDFNRFYVGEGFDPGVYALAFSRAVFLRMKTEPLWFLGTCGALVAIADLVRRRPLSPIAALAVCWGAAAACVIVVNGARLFNSYFIQALPPLSLLAAWFLCDWAAPSRSRQLAAAGAGVLAAVLLVQRGYAGRIVETAAADLSVLTGRTERLTYLERFGGYGNRRGYSARANAELAHYIAAHSEPDDRIFLFGINGAGVYFSADRLSAHRFLRVNFFGDTDFPDPSFTIPAVVRDLAARPPRYLVFERLHSTADPRVARTADSLPSQADVARLLEAYVLDRTIEDFTVYRRVD
jgi:hypothetical protein